MPIPRCPIAFDIIRRIDPEKKEKQHVIIYFNGQVEGLEGSFILRNYAMPVWLKMQALERELKREKEYNKQLEKRLGIK